jgi:glucose-6-phosphate 1-dehydrogenase
MQKNLPEPVTLIIFGASGDLTRRKLIPAIFNLYRQNLLPEEFSVVGFARSQFSDDQFREQLKLGLFPGGDFSESDQKLWSDFASRLFYHQGQYDDPVVYRTLREKLEKLSSPSDPDGNYLFYLATPPDAVPKVARRLKDADLARTGAQTPWSRIIVEKPFGHDLPSARKLNQQLTKVFRENQIFRIDHYLGKETVQNLMVFRFANAIFEPIWNNHFVDHVQIAVTETLGVENRGAFYDESGAIRDIVQNHMMHLVSLIAMESPVSLDADSIHDEKVKVLKCLRPLPEECVVQNVVRAQYAAGLHDGRQTVGYREEPDVPSDSRTETFVALKLLVDNWRWAGVPFYLRTGKRMPVRITEIGIHFKSIPEVLFNAKQFGTVPPNLLTIRIQPNEGISLQFQVKVPGPEMQIHPHKMDFSYLDSFDKTPPDAYERLLLDAALGDSTLFARNDEVEAAWAFLTPILCSCAQHKETQIPQYPAGSWGPKEGDDLIEADGRKWYLTRRPKPIL